MLGQLGPESDREDVVRHAWSAILSEYFLRLLPRGSHSYTIDSYRGPAPGLPGGYHQHAIVVKKQTMVSPSPEGSQPLTVSRDILWVEYKAPNHDTPAGWKDLIEQASNRLAVAHPNRMLFVIFAIGLKWMSFKWDPIGAVNAPPLQILTNNHAQGQEWTLPPQLRYDPTVPGQSHVVAYGDSLVTDTIDQISAYSLEYWTHDQQGQIKNWPALRLLEDCMAHILDPNYLGDTPELR